MFFFSTVLKIFSMHFINLQVNNSIFLCFAITDQCSRAPKMMNVAWTVRIEAKKWVTAQWVFRPLDSKIGFSYNSGYLTTINSSMKILHNLPWAWYCEWEKNLKVIEFEMNSWLGCRNSLILWKISIMINFSCEIWICPCIYSYSIVCTCVNSICMRRNCEYIAHHQSRIRIAAKFNAKSVWLWMHSVRSNSMGRRLNECTTG